jgi:hypothetical protein
MGLVWCFGGNEMVQRHVRTQLPLGACDDTFDRTNSGNRGVRPIIMPPTHIEQASLHKRGIC